MNKGKTGSTLREIQKRPHLPAPTPSRRIAFIDITPELLLEQFKGISNLPKDAVLIQATIPLYPTAHTADFWTAGKIVRLFIESGELVPIIEGEQIPKFELVGEDRPAKRD